MEQRARNNKVLIMILTALMIALTFVAGSVIKIPTLNGFMQPGDCMILLGAVLLGKKRGALSAAIGMGLIDATSGYLIWAPFSFVIQGAMGFVAGYLFERFKVKNYKAYLISFIVAGFVSLGGYFIANAIMGGIIMGAVHGFLPSVLYAVAHVPGDSSEIIFGIIIALILAPIVNKAKVKFNLK